MTRARGRFGALGVAAGVALQLTVVSAWAAPPAGAGPAGRAAPGESTGDRRAPVLEAVRELAKPVSYTETKISLGELVRKVAAEAGAPLVAARSVADEPVAVAVSDLPARELLEQLAELLDYQWARHGKEGAWRYEIWQDLASREREAALRQAALGGVEQRLRAQIGQYVTVAALSPAEIQRQAEEYERLRKQFFDLPYPQRMLAAPQMRQKLDHLRPAQKLASPVNRALAGFLGRLSPAQWTVLRSGQPLLFSSEPQPGELLLPEAMGRTFRAARPSMDTGWRTDSPEEEERQRQRQRDQEAAWAAASGYRVEIRLSGTNFRRDGLLALAAQAAPLAVNPASPRPNAQMQPDGFDSPEGASLQLSADPSEATEPEQAGSPERNAALEQDPVLGARKVLKPERKVGEGPPKNSWSLREALPLLARTYGVSVIADAYEADRYAFGYPGLEPLALYLLLDRYAGYHYRWAAHGKLIRLRSRDWFFARPKEVPLRLLHRWEEALARQGELTFEEYVEAATTLNDDQLESADRQVIELAERAKQPPGPQLFPPRHALRLYAALTPGQQAALWRGQPIPAGAMTAAQRALFLTALQERARSGEPDAPERAGPAGLSPEARFSLAQGGLIRIVEPGTDSTVLRTELAPTPPAPTPPRPGAKAPAVSRWSIVGLTFQLLGSPEQREAVTISVAAPGGTAPG